VTLEISGKPTVMDMGRGSRVFEDLNG
jgi:hypothetical protein